MSLLFSPFFLLARFPLCVYVCVCVCVCVSSLLFSPARNKRQRASIAYLLARAPLLLLSPPTTRLLLPPYIASSSHHHHLCFLFLFWFRFFLKITLQKMIMSILYKLFLLFNKNDFYKTNRKKNNIIDLSGHYAYLSFFHSLFSERKHIYCSSFSYIVRIEKYS